MSKQLKDYDVWYKSCKKCGYKTYKSISPKTGIKYCWRCGNRLERDYNKRALKK